MAGAAVSRLTQILSGRIAQLRSLRPRSRPGRMLRRGLSVIGWPGVLALGLLGAFPPFYFSAIVPAQERMETARLGTLSLREQFVQTGKSADGMRASPSEQLAQFYRTFPAQRNAPQWLEKIAALAQKNGLSLNEGEYKAVQAGTERLLRLQIVLPVKGEYPQIRSFLAALPAEIPIVALENVQFSRQNIADSTVEAHIRLALYLEQTP